MKVNVRVCPGDLPAFIPLHRVFDLGYKAAMLNPDLVSSVTITRTRTTKTSLRITSDQFYYMMRLGLGPREVIQIGLDQLRQPAQSYHASGSCHALQGPQP